MVHSEGRGVLNKRISEQGTLSACVLCSVYTHTHSQSYLRHEICSLFDVKSDAESSCIRARKFYKKKEKTNQVSVQTCYVPVQLAAV